MYRIKHHALLLALITIISFTEPAWSQRFYIKAKAYLDVRKGELISPANISIDGKYIKSINPATTPSDATIIEKPDLILLPGLIDAHVHIPINLDKGWELDLVTEDAAAATLRGAKNANILLNAGFTTVRSMGQIYPVESFIDVALATASDKGWINAPHIIPAGHALSITGGHLDPEMNAHYIPNLFHVNYRLGIADGVDEVTKATRYQIKHGAKVIKIAATAGVLSEEENVGAQQFSDAEMKAIVDEANRHHIPVAAHAHGAEGIKAAIRAGVHSIEHASLIDDEGISLMKKNDVYLVSTTYYTDAIDLRLFSPAMQKKANYLMPLAQKNLAKAIKLGVKVVFGTDAPVVPFTDTAKEFSALVARGMTPIQAIRSATLTAVEMLNLSDRGEIKAGLLADIVGVEDDPLKRIETLQHVKFVMKDGRIYKN